MARDEVLRIGERWSELTANDVTRFTLSVRGPGDIEISAATTSAGIPDNDFTPRGHLVERGVAILNRSMVELFPGVTDAARVFGRLPPGGADGHSFVYVSHA